MLFGRLLGEGLWNLRHLTAKPLTGTPLEQLEGALQNVIREVCHFFLTHGPKPLHKRLADGSLFSPSLEEHALDEEQRLLRAWLRQSEVLSRNEVIGVSPSGGPSILTMQCHDARHLFELFVRNNQEEQLRSLDPLALLMSKAPPEWNCLLITEDEAHPPANLAEMRVRAWNGFVGEYVRDYLWLAPQVLNLDERVAHYLFIRLKQRIARGRQCQYRLTPLLKLWLNGPALELLPRLKLRAVSAMELDRWLNPDPLCNEIPLRGLDVLGLRSVLEYEEPGFQTIMWERDLHDELKLELPEFVALVALNLLMGEPSIGYIIEPTFAEKLREGSLREGFRTRIGGASFNRAFMPGHVSLSVDDAKRLQALVPRIYDLFSAETGQAGASQDGGLTIALRRWFSSCRRGSPKDWLIDCWVALEGLFTRRGEGSLTTKCAERISKELATLGVGPADNLQRAVRESYESRCEIVHGERTQGRNYQDEAIRTRDYLRTILLHRLGAR